LARDAADTLVAVSLVVVHLGSGVAGKRPQNPSGVLDEAPAKGDRGGEEQGVQGGAVKPSPMQEPVATASSGD
jgi:hypothetical protein